MDQQVKCYARMKCVLLRYFTRFWERIAMQCQLLFINISKLSISYSFFTPSQELAMPTELFSIREIHYSCFIDDLIRAFFMERKDRDSRRKKLAWEMFSYLDERNNAKQTIFLSKQYPSFYSLPFLLNSGEKGRIGFFQYLNIQFTAFCCPAIFIRNL